MIGGMDNKSLQQSPGVSSIAGCFSRLNRLGGNGAAALLNSMLCLKEICNLPRDRGVGLPCREARRAFLTCILDGPTA